jgi:preprotein translocase subunit SecA
MNIFSRTLDKIFKTGNQKELDRVRSLVDEINNQEDKFKNIKNEEFRAKTELLKESLRKGRKITSLIPESFALVREAASRVLNERHYNAQLVGGIFLHEGKIAEMKTGEGKTLVSTLPAYLNALTKKGVHIVTVNDYLAKRDSEWMGKVFNFLGLTTGCITNELDDLQRKKNYENDITYATNNELGFDYLRDNMKYDLTEMVQRDHNYCIVDEVDSILIDESRTPLVISGRSEDKSNYYLLSNKFINKLQKLDYEIDEKNKNAILTDVGIDKIEKLGIQEGILKNNNFYDPQNLNLVHHINQSLKANFLFNKDVDYIVRENKVQIIDEFTGRILEGRRFSDGLHQSIEAKENVEIQEENQTLASITYQNYFRLYRKLSGMTGTALTESEEFFDIYKLNVVSVPTNRPMIRKDFNDQIFRTEKEKYLAITNKIIDCHKSGQPVLVGTTSIEKSEKISKNLIEKKIKHNVLNAKQHEKEAKVIAEAGKIGAITIATNMAGRGTDIQLGGNKDFRDEDNQKELSQIQEDKEKVKLLGGLYIVGTERHESRRIDNQLRGRSGRQGDPGSSIFYISLEDELMRIFGANSIDGMLKKLGLKENESIDHPWINKAMERAQQKVEGRNFDVRKTLIKFDDVMNDQRQVIFSQRLKILKSKNISETLNSFLEEVVVDLLKVKNNFEKSNDKTVYLNTLKNILGNILNDNELVELTGRTEKEFSDRLKSLFKSKQIERIKLIGEDENNDIEKKIFLQIIDFSWRSHLQYLEQLRQVIGLRSYGQKDPLSEFKKESFGLFEGLLEKIKIDVVKYLLNLNVVISREKEVENKIRSKIPENCLLNLMKNQKIQRNEKCTATGKKFKNCCGANL